MSTTLLKKKKMTLKMLVTRCLQYDTDRVVDSCIVKYRYPDRTG